MRGFFAGTLLVVAVIAAGCGGGGGGGGTTQSSPLATKSPGAVVATAAKAAEAASSFHMSGQIHASGKDIGIDLTVAPGKGATGTLTVNGAKVDLVLIGNNGYLRGSSEFFKEFASQAGSFAQILADKWLKFPANNAQLGSLTGPTNAKALFKSLTGNHGKLENQGDTTYNGQSVVAIRDTTKNGTLYVASSGPPYPVALVKTGKNAGTISFDQWNQPVTLTAPKGALDFSQLAGKG
jgi:hypothetical protein